MEWKLYTTEKKLVESSRKEKATLGRVRQLYKNTNFLYFNHRLYNYKELFPILENKKIITNMPLHYETSFLRKKK